MMMRRLDNITQPFDLCVTICENDDAMIKKIKNRYPNAKIIKLGNRGYDIYPFLVALDAMGIEKYDFVVKLHTKRDYPVHYYFYPHPMFGARWRKAITSFVQSKTHFNRCMEAFAKDKKLGIQADFRVIMNRAQAERSDRHTYAMCMKYLGELFPKLSTRKKLNFVAGTMFVARTEALIGMARINLHKEDFPDGRKMKRLRVGSIAHCMERFIGFYACAAGFKVADEFHSPTEHFFINLRAQLYYNTIRPILILIRKRVIVNMRDKTIRWLPPAPKKIVYS